MEGQNFRNTIRAALDSSPRNQKNSQDFLSKMFKTQRYVVGRNDQSAELIRKFHIDGVVDDFDKTNTHWQGVPIISTTQLPTCSIVVNCSTSISPIAVNEHLIQSGIRNIVSINELIYAANGNISLPWFVAQQRNEMLKNPDAWENLYDLLDDVISQQTFIDVIRYRLTADEQYMRGYKVRMKDQYFEDFLGINKEVLVDAGGFDGDTTEEFCCRYPDYRKVFLFEPSVKNMEAAKKRLLTYNNIEFRQVGLSDAEGTLQFNADNGPASSITQCEGENIQVTTLDQAVKEPVTFIKMDLEGWEMKALAGSAGHIAMNKPKLAIAVYHTASDFLEVPRYVRSLNPEYRIYLRHYTQGWSETVMYFM